MRWFVAVALMGTFAFEQNARASKPLAPSRTRALCERLLISTGLWRPPVKATLNDNLPGGHFDKDKFIVSVQSPHSQQWTTFNRTDRDFFELKELSLYPSQYLRASVYQGLKVLDLACGDGRLVTELRRAQIEAVGLDIFLNRYQLTKPYFIRASAENTGLPGSSLDVVFSTQGPLTYLADEPEHQRSILREIHRILKPGGRALISPVDPKIVELLPPGLRVKAKPDKFWLSIGAENTNFERANYWLELEKAP